jgi:hypothetical protein
MKITKTQLKQMIKEELVEARLPAWERPGYVPKPGLGPDDASRAAQKEKRAAKEAEAEEVRQALGNDWEVNVRMLENRYQLTVNKAVWAQEPGTNPQENW